MKCKWTFLLMFLSTLAMEPGPCMAQSLSNGVAGDPVSLAVDFHSGETVRYAFSLKMNLTNRADPRIPSEKIMSFTPRQYTVEGVIVATLAPAQPGAALHGSVQFQGLTVKNWVSSANVADLEARLRVLEATSITLTTTADGSITLTEASPRPPQDRFVLDAEDLESIAQAVLISRISNQPLEPGQHVESADFPIPGMVRPGIKLAVVTDYLADVPIAHHRSAEVRLSMQVPNQAHPISSQSNTSKTFERYYATGVWTYLLDLDAHQISFLHKTIRTETGYTAESPDSNDPIRIPTNLFTVDTQFEVMARRVEAGASPQREADLTAFANTLQSPPTAAMVEPGPAGGVSPSSETSLGDIGRRYRAERAAQETPAAEPAKPEGAAAPAGPVAPEVMAAGFKHETFPSGGVTVQIPSRATDIVRTGNIVTIRYHLGEPTPLIVIALVEMNLDPGETAEHALNGVVPGIEASQAMKVIHAGTTTINGMPGVVVDAIQSSEMNSRVMETLVISGGKMFITSCGTLQTDFPRVKSLCQTVINSPRALYGGPLPGSAER